MQKTKLGISVGLMGAIVCLAGYYSGVLALVLIGAYIFFKEENEWLKKLCVRVLVAVLAFCIVDSVLTIIPDVFGLLSDLVGLIGISLRFTFINDLVYLVMDVIDLLQKLIFIGLGLKALNQGTIKLPVIDSMVDKYMA